MIKLVRAWWLVDILRATTGGIRERRVKSASGLSNLGKRPTTGRRIWATAITRRATTVLVIERKLLPGMQVLHAGTSHQR
jgi:hypothetical protein